jgi:TP901 family phage tail tape measure protein
VPLNTRDLWLLLKAQDQTNRALNTFSRNVKNAGDTVAMAQLQAQKAAALGAVSQAKLRSEVLRAANSMDVARQAATRHEMAIKNNVAQVLKAETAQLGLAKSLAQQELASLQAGRGTATQIQAKQTQISQINDEIRARRLVIAQVQSEVAALQGDVNMIQTGVNARKSQIATNQQYIAQQHQVLAGIDQEIKQVEAHNRSIQEAEKHQARMANSLQQVSQTATAMGFAMAAGGVAAFVGLKQALDAAVAYEKQVRATATQVDGFTGNLQQLGDIGRRLAKDIAVPFEQIQPALFDIFSSMEINMTDAEKLLKEFSKAAVAGGVDIQDVSRATIGLLNAFQRPVSDVNKLLDIQFQLVQEGVGTYEEWNQRIGLVTPSAVRAGQSIEVMMAALAASTRMGMSAARSGTAVARSFDALSNPKTVDNLKKLGVNVQDAQGKFRPFNEVLRDFRTVLNNMPEKDRLATILDVFKGAGGTIEARRFLQNVLLGAGNLEMFDSILKETSNSAGSMEKAYTLMAESTAAKTQLLKNQWSLMKEAVGTALLPLFGQFVGYLASLAQSFNNLSPQTKKFITYALVLVAVFTSVMGVVLLLIGVVAAVAAAFVVAGSTIAVVVGILVSFVAIAGVVAAVFTLLWKKSDGFRTLMGMMAENFGLLTGVMKGFARDVGAAFKEHLEGPLRNLWQVIQTYLLPAIISFYQMYSSTLLPKLKESARIIADVYESGFKKLGEGITNYVIPAIKSLSEWWGKNKENVKPFLEILAQVVKWFLIIAAVIVGVVVVAIVATLGAALALIIAPFLLIGAAVYFAWQGLKWLWDQIVTFAKWISGVFVSAWNAVVDAIVAAWNWLASFFASIWNGIKGIFTSAWNWISSTWNAFASRFASDWNAFWNGSIGQLIIAVFQVIGAAAELGWAALVYIFEWGMKWIIGGWNATWANVSAFFSAIWSGIAAVASAIWHSMVALWQAIWPPVRDFFMMIWNGIKTFFIAVWNIISSTASNAWNGIKSGLSSAWEYVKLITISAWNAVYNAVAGPLRNAYEKVTGFINQAKAAFNGAGTWLYNAGAEIVNGLINGITNKLHALRDKINEMTSIISDHLPGSPVKKGPLRVLNRGYAGGQIVKMLSDGINQQLGMLQSSADLVGNGVITGFGTDLGQGEGGGMTKNYYITQNITTQEISPIRQAAALGWEVTTVM